MADYAGTELFAQQYEPEVTYGLQPAFGGLQVTFLATRAEPSFSPEVEELKLGTAKAFSQEPRVVGSKHGSTVTFSMPLEGQASTFTIPGALVVTPCMQFFEYFFGQVDTGSGLAADVAAASTAVIAKFTASTPNEGACIYVGDNGATTVEAIGWVTDCPASDATVFSDMIGIPTAGNDFYGMKTYYSNGSTDITSCTLRLKHWSDDQDVFFIGAVPEGFNLRVHAGMVPMVEWTFRFNRWEYATASGDGLPIASGPSAAIVDYQRLNPIMLENNGRIVVNGPTAGTVNIGGNTDFGSFEVAVTGTLKDHPKHGGYQGVGFVSMMGRHASVTFTDPWVASKITGTQDDWSVSFETGSTNSFELHVGDKVGKVFAMIIPAAVTTEQPQLVDEDGIQAWQVTVAPDQYSADTGTTDPANSTFRIAMG